ncbi:MAG: tetratricopeptide repeat protein [Opitutaceae bacterium]|jgi:tetratricopeptide (TPR) repeat protein|nr:tetratricopeptide repeat protein [Opitutaceae bacterium]
MSTRICLALFTELIFSFAICIARIPLFAQTAPAPALLSDKTGVLTAIAIIEERLPERVAFEAAALLMRCVEDSEDVVITLAPTITPWFQENGGFEDEKAADGARMMLLVAYEAGNVKTQLVQGNTKEDFRAGWLMAIRVHRRFPEFGLGKFPSVERLAALERAGFLTEYAGIIEREISAARNVAPKPPIPDKERLSRDYLDPAFDLARAHKFAEAHAIYEAWLAQNPFDAEAHCAYAGALRLEANASNDSAKAGALTKAARPHVLKAFVLGSKDPLLDNFLDITNPNRPADAVAFSDNKKAHERIARAEKAFAQHRYADARKEYQRALKYDPKSYVATLYVGDCYFVEKKYADAIRWFNKAIELQPHIETAHRYMGDALLQMGKPEEAIAKHIDALLAEPAGKLPRAMMERVAKSVNRLYKPSPVNKLPMGAVSFDLEKKEIALGFDSATQSPYVTGYLMARGAWIGEQGAGHFPKGEKPRHCAAEEVAGLGLFSKVVLEQNGKNDADASDWLAAAEAIRRLEQAGLLEAFVYIDRADADIAKDYPAYREEHRDLLVRYIREFWLAEEPAQ